MITLLEELTAYNEERPVFIKNIKNGHLSKKGPLV
jgi:hypothetical protein